MEEYLMILQWKLFTEIEHMYNEYSKKTALSESI